MDLPLLMFWIAATIMVMLVMLAVYVPLGRMSKTDTTKPALMRALAAELEEVKADKGQRFSTAAEAAAARAEIGRRLLAIEAEPEKSKPVHHTSPLFALFALLPILAVPLYLQLGQPEYADQAMAYRMNEIENGGQQDITKLIERVETRLAAEPEDGEGWAVIAPIYFRLGRIEDSLNAYSKAMNFYKGDQAGRLRLMADRAEILVTQQQGVVSVEAASTFNEVLALEPNNQKALFYLALQLEQTGDAEKAISNWEALIARFKNENPRWLDVAAGRLADLKRTPTTVPPNGPTQEQVEAAGDMTPEQRSEMIKGMVDGLAAKLA
ncbi:MAG: c-type cytochrome biogenesis protein CcmI, partial [Notoacmeibacter sp.]